MSFGRRLRVLRRVWERAALRLRIEWLKVLLRMRADQALTMIETGESVRDLGRRLNDRSIIADGFALIDRGTQQLNEIETGQVAEPRPAAWWKHRD